MKTPKEKLLQTLKTSVCILALTGVLMMPHAAAYAASENAPAAKASAQTAQNSQNQTAEKRKEIISEAVSALNETQKALKSLDGKKNKDALASLQVAAGKLEIILARDPSLSLAPTGVTAATYNMLGTIDDVKKVRKNAEKLLDDGHVQQARRLMMGLASETVISTANIPLATYPAAIKQAAKLIDADKTEEAKALLQTALNTLIITEKVIPLPVAAAEAMLKDAEKLAENKTRKEEESKRLSDLLTAADVEIKFAEALGYGGKKDFEHFYDEIEKIRDETTDGKSGSGFFEKIKGYMSSMNEDSQHEKTASKP